jgi:hypothetical protein
MNAMERMALVLQESHPGAQVGPRSESLFSDRIIHHFLS